MRIASLSAAVGLLWITAAMAQDAAPGAGYKPLEKSNLTLCATVTLSAKSIAEYKVAGMPEEKTDRYFGHAPGQKRNPLVHEVYGSAVTDAWDYAAGYFQSCAVDKVKIAAARIGPAATCMRNTMIADTAISLRILGKTREETQAYLQRFGDEEAQQVIGAVYAPPAAPKRETALDTWNGCLGIKPR